MMLRPSRDEVLLALGCGLWAAWFLAGEGAGGLATAPLLGLAALICRRVPVLAALAVPALVLLVDAIGVPQENPAPTAAAVVVLYALGRHGTGPVVALPLIVSVVVPWVLDDFGLATGVFSLVTVGANWAVGRLVRRRAEDARRATATAAELAARDPAHTAEGVVAEERARLAGAALHTVREAVAAMQGHAQAAEGDLDAQALSAIGADGRGAVTDLRRLLGLLRSEPQPAPLARPRRRPPWHLDALTAALVALVALVEAALYTPAPSAGSVAFTLALATSLTARRTDLATACLLATVLTLAALASDVGLFYSFALVSAIALLGWSAGVAGGYRAYASVGALTVAVLLDCHLHNDPGNEPFTAALFTVATIAGHLWGARDREGRAANRTAAQLQAEHDAVVEAAVRAERLRLARELHDVASHAVGVMVLQAGAAAALRDRDPGAARDAVRAVQSAGVEAMTELDVLFGLLDDGAVGPAGLARPPGHADLAEALGQLAARIRDAGLDVRLTVPPDLSADEARLATAYRTVQEALTNAVRHAPGSRVTVTVFQDPEGLHIEVCDDGPGSASGDPGFGLVGLAERVRSLGGELVVGPRPEGGFGVRAVLPARAGADA